MSVVHVVVHAMEGGGRNCKKGLKLKHGIQDSRKYQLSKCTHYNDIMKQKAEISKVLRGS